MTAYAICSEYGWVPANREAAALHKGCVEGRRVAIEIERERNKGQHDKMFAMARVVRQNLPERFGSLFPTEYLLIKFLQVRCGFADAVPTKDGVVHIPHSIAFDKMGQGKFEEVYNALFEYVVTEVIPGIDADDLREAVANEIAAFG